MENLSVKKLVDEKAQFERTFKNKLEELKRELNKIAPSNLQFADRVLDDILKNEECRLERDCLNGDYIGAQQMRKNLHALKAAWEGMIKVEILDTQTYIYLRFTVV